MFEEKCPRCQQKAMHENMCGACGYVERPETVAYEFRNFWIPTRMMPGIRRYIEKYIKPGDFLTQVICNNLKEACGKADEENMTNLPAYVAYFYNEAPSPCWGSPEKMEAWLKLGEKEKGNAG